MLFTPVSNIFTSFEITSNEILSAFNFNVFEDEAMEWIDKSISIEEGYWNYYIKAQLLVNSGNKDDAKKAFDKSKELAMKSPDEYEDMKSSYDDLEAKL